MKKKNVLIGVAWPYVNGELHIGHLAGYLVPADICARFHRLIGNNVLMVSGSDCHGTPITVEAERRNLSPEEIVNEYHPKHKNLFELYNLSFDNYTTTTTKNHQKVVHEMFVKLAENGYIYKDSSHQYFSSEEGKFLPDRYVEGVCPHCKFPHARGDQCDQCCKTLEAGELIESKSKLTGNPVTLKKTEHYFFDLPKLEPFLRKYVKKNKHRWREWVAKETLGWLKTGLKPRCITRDLDWGVRIPVSFLPKKLQIKDAENKRIYVWFEAVIGYLSASVEWAKGSDKWRDFWYPTNLTGHYYFMGKDNLVFHTLFWPAQLHGTYEGIHLPDYPVINHFLNLEGHKFSKSRGITVSSKYIGETYGVAAVRFYMTLIMPETSDANFSWSHFVETHNGVLIGTLGNFIHRVLKLANRLGDFSETEVEGKVVKKLENLLKKARTHAYNCKFKLYAQTVIDIAAFGNKYLDQNSPWNLKKDSEEFKKVITNALLIILAINLAVGPIIPYANEQLSKMLGIELDFWPEEKATNYLKGFLSQVKIATPKPLFDKIESSVIEAERAKLNI